MGFIIVGDDLRCHCNCATRCPVDGRYGSSMRCSKEEIETKGYKAVLIKGWRPVSIGEKAISKKFKVSEL